MRNKNAIANIITELLVQFTNIICAFIIHKLIISNYGSSVNGLLTSVTKFLAYITLIEAGFGIVIKSALFKPIAKKDKGEIERILKASQNIFKKIAYIFILYIVILCCTLPFTVKEEFDIFYTVSLILIISLSTLAEYYLGMTYRLFLQADQKRYITSIIQIGSLILNAGATIILINFKCNIQIVKLVSSLIFVSKFFIQYIYIKKKYDINLKNEKSVVKIKQKWDSLIQHIAYVIHTNIDVVILTLFANLKEVSVYAIYIMIIEGIKKVMQSFTNGTEAMFGDMIAKGEKEQLKISFKKYEKVYWTIATVAFLSTFFLLVPFVKLYTKGINDVNYARPIFAYIIVISEFIYVIRQLYYSIVKVAGHFKQTKVGAIVEIMINIIISFILVWKYGIVGVAIGTLVSTLVRTVEIIYYTSKNILDRSIKYVIKIIIAVVFEFLIVIFLSNLINLPEISNYIEWIKQAIIIVLVSAIVVIPINLKLIQ